MTFVFETVAETQKASLAAVGVFTDNFLVVIEHMTQLNIELTRTALEKSSEMSLYCLEGCLATENPFAWKPFVESADR